MAIVSKKTFLNTNQKNQQKAASTQQSGIANRADFVAGASGGNSEMQRRKMAYENYKKAVEAQRRVQAANAQRQQLLAGEARTDAMRDAAQAYSQSGYGKEAQQAGGRPGAGQEAAVLACVPSGRTGTQEEGLPVGDPVLAVGLPASSVWNRKNSHSGPTLKE